MGFGMSDRLYLSEIYDLSIVKDILTMPEMWERISEDGQEKAHFFLDKNPDFYWIGVFKHNEPLAKNELIGLFFLHALNSTTLQIHAHILKEFRKEFGKKAGAKIIEYFSKNTPFQKLIAEIPVIYENVYRYTKQFGFVDEGINRKSYTKNGAIVDQYRLGLTRDEAKQWLQLQ